MEIEASIFKQTKSDYQAIIIYL